MRLMAFFHAGITQPNAGRSSASPFSRVNVGDLADRRGGSEANLAFQEPSPQGFLKATLAMPPRAPPTQRAAAKAAASVAAVIWGAADPFERRVRDASRPAG